jgi:multiple sugar transport system substrate-binding protein
MPLDAMVMLVPILLAAGCSGSAAHDGGTTVRLWAVGREGEVVQQLVPAFERENPGVRVQVQQIPWTAAHEKLLTAFVGNATPDVAQLGNTWVAEFEALDALEPLDRWVASSRVVDSAAYFAGIWSTNVLDDTLFGVPWYVDTRVIFYRKDILRRAGYTRIPESWDGWVKAMRAMRAQMGPSRWPIFLPTNEWVQPMVLGMQTGSPILRDGGRYGAFADSNFRRGFDFYISLFRDSLAPPLGNNDIANPYQEFARGRFAMWITGPWNLGEFHRRLPPELQDSWGTAPLPGPTGDSSGVSLAGGSSLVLFRASRHKAAAWRLVEFLSRPEQQLAFSRLTGDLPSRIDAWQRSGLADSANLAAFWVQLHRTEPLPKVPENELIATMLYQRAEEVIRGGRPIAATLAALDRDVNRVLEKRRWVLARAAATR